MPNTYNNEYILRGQVSPSTSRGWGEVDKVQLSEDRLLQILTDWGQHPDATHPDFHGSTLYVNTADLNQLAKLILEAGFRIGGPS
jgi:hypothetical protein